MIEAWKPTELAAAINAAGFGDLTNTRKLFHLRKAAGLAGRRIDLAGLLGHLIGHRAKSDAEKYDKNRAKAAERSKSQSAAGRDIGPIPPVKNPERKERARHDFAFALKTYFPDAFPLEWSEDHLRIIARMQTIVQRGGLLAMAMPRGSGKSTISECVAILAVLYGFRRFVVLIGAEKDAAVEMLDSVKMEMEENELLAEDFPEVIFPIRALEGIANRCAGQIQNGKRTHILWTDTAIVLPSIEGSPAGGAIVRACGITGRIRGMKLKRPDGTTSRPDFVIPDDPQTDEVARRPQQCDNRESVLAGAVLGLAGPGRKIAGVMPCTIIRPDDVAARMLDRGRNPEWNGETTKMVYQWPTTEAANTLWKQYAKLRAEGMRRGDDGRAATEFYRKHRKEMDEGAVVGWPARFNADELSALQNAYNLRLRNEQVFWAEYQNEPQVEETAIRQLTSEEVLARLNGYARGIVPKSASHLTAYIDVQLSMFFWVVVAWRDDFKGDIVAYGEFPEQNRPWFTVRDSQNTLALRYGGGEEANLMAGLGDLTRMLIEREWRREDGTGQSLDRVLIDADYQPAVVYQLCRKSPHKAVLYPAKSRFVGPENKPMAEYNNKPGDRAGLNWRIPAPQQKRAIRQVDFDVNFWKSFTLARLMNPMGSAGSLEIYGEDPKAHKLLAHHLTAEMHDYQTSAKTGRTVSKWIMRPGYSENHWWDCLVGCAVGAAIQGASLPELAEVQPPKREKIKLSDLQKQKRAR